MNSPSPRRASNGQQVVPPAPNAKSSKSPHVVVTIPQPNFTSTEERRFYEKFEFWSYLRVEILGLDEGAHKLDDEAVESVANFVVVPGKVERVILYGVWVCIDSFLFVLTFLPIRCLAAVTLLQLSAIKSWTSMSKQSTNRSYTTSSLVLHASYRFDLMRGVLLVIGSLSLYHMNMGALYHYIRGQTMVKLYVLTGMLEVFDKLLCSFGRDAFASLFSATKSRKSFRTLLFFFTVTGCYVIVHAATYFVHIATLTVAINSSDQALTTVYVLNNFAEIKSYVFKKFDAASLFQLVCQDITERFQLLLFIALISIVSLAQSGAGGASVADVAYGLLITAVLMWFGESLADWIKHSFIIKNNDLDEDVYQGIEGDIRQDVLSARMEQNATTGGLLHVDRSYDLASTVGLSQVVHIS